MIDKERSRRTKKAWRQRNREKVAAWLKSWQDRNPEKRRAGVKEWGQRNPDKKRAGVKAWAERNPDKIAAKNAASRAGIRRAAPPWIDRRLIQKIYKKAQACTRMAGRPYHVDHAYPIKHALFSGLHVPWNLRIIPATENQQKKNRVTPEMLRGIFPDWDQRLQGSTAR